MITGKKDRGFFVEYSTLKYSEPFELLSDARKDARKRSSSLKIYHGIIVYKNGKIDSSLLSLVPKIKA